MADDSGNVLVTGEVAGGLDFGCGAITSAGAADALVAERYYVAGEFERDIGLRRRAGTQ